MTGDVGDGCRQCWGSFLAIGAESFGLASLGVVRGVVADRNGLSGAEEVTGDVGDRGHQCWGSFLHRG